MEVTLYKGSTAETLQKFHIQQVHLSVVAEDISPLSCPVRGCEKWGSTRRDSRTLRNHVTQVGEVTWAG